MIKYAILLAGGHSIRGTTPLEGARSALAGVCYYPVDKCFLAMMRVQSSCVCIYLHDHTPVFPGAHLKEREPGHAKVLEVYVVVYAPAQVDAL